MNITDRLVGIKVGFENALSAWQAETPFEIASEHLRLAGAALRECTALRWDAFGPDTARVEEAVAFYASEMRRANVKMLAILADDQAEAMADYERGVTDERPGNTDTEGD